MEKENIIAKSLLSCLDNRIRLARHTNFLPSGLQPQQAGISPPSSQYPFTLPSELYLEIENMVI
jgi:hypothetical protein